MLIKWLAIGAAMPVIIVVVFVWIVEHYDHKDD